MAVSLAIRLYESWRRQSGLYLSAEDVQRLLTLDDAAQTRITNEIAMENGLPPQGAASGLLFSPMGSVKRFLDEARKGNDDGD